MLIGQRTDYIKPNQIVKWKVHIILLNIIEFDFITTSCTFKTMSHKVLHPHPVNNCMKRVFSFFLKTYMLLSVAISYQVHREGAMLLFFSGPKISLRHKPRYFLGKMI